MGAVATLGKNLMLDALKGTNPTTPITHAALFDADAGINVTGENVDEPLTIQVYPGADGSFRMYDDDGVSFGYATGDWMGIDMRWQDKGRQLTLSLSQGSRFRAPARRIVVRVVGTKQAREVTFSGQPLAIRF